MNIMICMQKYAKRRYKNCEWTNHFWLRMFQRCNYDERSKILAEIAALSNSGMSWSLFSPQDNHEAKVKLHGKTLVVAQKKKNQKLRLITVY